MAQHQAAGFNKLEEILKILIASPGPPYSRQKRMPRPSQQVGAPNGIENSPWLSQRPTSPIFDFTEENTDVIQHDD